MGAIIWYTIRFCVASVVVMLFFSVSRTFLPIIGLVVYALTVVALIRPRTPLKDVGKP